MRALALIAALWAGMLIGVSLIATPVKFTAPTLDLAAALDVGRVTFGLFSKVEWVTALGLAVAVLAVGPRVWAVALTGGLWACLVAQGLWLLPILNARVAAVIAGSPAPPSPHHGLYAGIEVLKLTLLVVFVVMACRAVRDRGADVSLVRTEDCVAIGRSPGVFIESTEKQKVPMTIEQKREVSSAIPRPGPRSSP